MGRISSKTLNVKDQELDDLLDDEDEVDEIEEEEEEVIEAKPRKKVKKQPPKKEDCIYVILNEAATYSLDGKIYKRHEMVKEPRSKLKKFQNNGWFSVRY